MDSTSTTIKFNNKTRKVTIGGFRRLQSLIESIIEDYFDHDVPAPVINRNKMKYTIYTGRRIKFDKALLKLEDHNFVVKRVENQGHIMR